MENTSIRPTHTISHKIISLFTLSAIALLLFTSSYVIKQKPKISQKKMRQVVTNGIYR